MIFIEIVCSGLDGEHAFYNTSHCDPTQHHELEKTTLSTSRMKDILAIKASTSPKASP